MIDKDERIFFSVIDDASEWIYEQRALSLLAKILPPFAMASERQGLPLS